MRTFLRAAVDDGNGNVSHARIIALVVAFSATVFMWKLTVMGTLTVEYFIAYIAMGVIHMNLSKSLDVIQSIFGRGYERSRNPPTVGGGLIPERGIRRGGSGANSSEDIRDFDDGAGVKTPQNVEV